MRYALHMADTYSSAESTSAQMASINTLCDPSPELVQ
jgi:hypothetical protein